MAVYTCQLGTPERGVWGASVVGDPGASQLNYVNARHRHANSRPLSGVAGDLARQHDALVEMWMRALVSAVLG